MDNNALSVDTFNRLAKQYQDKYMDFDHYFDSYDTFCQLLKTKNASVLEIGCGPGNVTRYLLNKRSDLQITGIDLAPNMIELAKANNPTAHFRVMDSRNLSDLNHHYDAVFSGFCTPYLNTQEVENLIKDVSSCLSVGGLFHISTMEGESARSGLQTSSKGDQMYIYYHTFSDITAMLEKYAFEIIKVDRKVMNSDATTPDTDLFIYAKKRAQ